MEQNRKRTRVCKGTLVASTNKLNYIFSKRLHVEVIYTKSYKIIKENVKSINHV